MAGREVREYTNLTDPKDRKFGKGKDKIDDEDITFQRMVAKMQEVAGERALDSDDLLYLKEQMEAEEDAERLLRRTEKRAFAEFKKAATMADTSPASVPLPLRVEPKPKSGIRQQDLLKKVVEVKPKRPRVSDQLDRSVSASVPSNRGSEPLKKEESAVSTSMDSKSDSKQTSVEEELLEKPSVQSLLGLAYESSDDDDDDE
ncbi:hypothetical protein LINPERHAP2_LOCUS22614 [Linum perenne]